MEQKEPKTTRIKLGPWERLTSGFIFGMALIDVIIGISGTIINHCYHPLLYWGCWAMFMISYGIMYVRLQYEKLKHKRTFHKLRLLSDIFNDCCEHYRDIETELPEYSTRTFAECFNDWMRGRTCIIALTKELDEVIEERDPKFTWCYKVEDDCVKLSKDGAMIQSVTYVNHNKKVGVGLTLAECKGD